MVSLMSTVGVAMFPRASVIVFGLYHYSSWDPLLAETVWLARPGPFLTTPPLEDPSLFHLRFSFALQPQQHV